jgi:hypothetical protein
MKILFTMRLCSRELGTRLAAEPLLAKALKPVPNAAVGFLFPKAFDAAGPVLQRLLELAGKERLSLLRDMQFSPAELDQASHLEVKCKLTIGQTRADATATHAAYAAEGLRPTASRWRVRLPQRIFLRKPVRPDTIAHVDQWTGEYAVGAQAAQSLRASGLSGWRLQPLFLPGGRQAADLHLTTGELLPAALEDETRIETFDDGRGMPGTPRRYGLLSYADCALDGSADFARTAEPFGPWCTPLWVVRQPVRRWFTGAGLRGWGFWPVLREGSEPHGQHLPQWRQALAILDAGGAELMA